jgi:hypothetical protein
MTITTLLDDRVGNFAPAACTRLRHALTQFPVWEDNYCGSSRLCVDLLKEFVLYRVPPAAGGC